jgi:phospholipase/carboxylesterase
MTMLRRTVLLGGLGALAAPAILRAAQTPQRADRLDGPRLAPARTPAEWLVVLCHGSGGDGPNMYPLARPLQAWLPGAAFVSPTGPFPREDFGYRWFPGAVAGDPIGMVMRGMRESGPLFNTFLEAELARHRLGSDRLILLGFSQGSMMVLNAGLRRQPLPAGIIAFAGLQLATDGLPRFSGAPPVLVIQGAQDGNGAERVRQTSEALKRLGVPAEAHVLPNLGHSIDERGIRLAGEFMQKLARAKPA